MFYILSVYNPATLNNAYKKVNISYKNRQFSTFLVNEDFILFYASYARLLGCNKTFACRNDI